MNTLKQPANNSNYLHTHTFEHTHNEKRAADSCLDRALEYMAGSGSKVPCVPFGCWNTKEIHQLVTPLCQKSYQCQLSSGLDWLSSELQERTRCQALELNVAFSSQGTVLGTLH